MTAYLPIFLVLFLMFMGVPVATSMLAASIFYFGFLTDGYQLTNMIQTLVSQIMGLGKMAGAYFVIAGVMMNYGRITERLVNFCDALVGHKEGALGQVNVILSTLNGGVCSSASADAALECKILVPEMTKHGYPLAFSTAVTAASSLIAPIIPPGGSLINYAILANVSIGQMFFAGYIPGAMLCIAQMAVVGIYARKNHWRSSRDKRATFKEILLSLKEAIWSLVMPLTMIMGIRSGWFTPTEGGIVMITLSTLVAVFLHKTVKIKQIPGMLKEAAYSFGGIMLLIVTSLLFGNYLNWERIPQNLTAMLMEVTTSPIVFMIIVNVLLLFLGMFVEGTPLLLIMTPLLAPMAELYGINLVAFGIIIIINIAMGSLTPPFGGLMYITCGITGCSIPAFLKYGWAFLVSMAAVLIILVIFPQIITFLPGLVYGLGG